jgi:hypothetical protein
MAKDIIIVVDAGGIGASFPNDPVEGRFRLRGVVTGGTKPMVGRQVEIELTHSELQGVVNNGASALLRHPKCGITPKADDDG